MPVFRKKDPYVETVEGTVIPCAEGLFQRTAIVPALVAVGAYVKQSSQYRRKVRCPHCGKYSAPAGHLGEDPGLPDVWFRFDEWPDGLWAGVEVKAPQGGELTPGQREVLDNRGSVLAQDVRPAAEYATALRNAIRSIAPGERDRAARVAATMRVIRKRRRG